MATPVFSMMLVFDSPVTRSHPMLGEGTLGVAGGARSCMVGVVSARRAGWRPTGGLWHWTKGLLVDDALTKGLEPAVASTGTRHNVPSHSTLRRRWVVPWALREGARAGGAETRPGPCPNRQFVNTLPTLRAAWEERHGWMDGPVGTCSSECCAAGARACPSRPQCGDPRRLNY